jgi:sulfonate transport system permease protein
MSLTTLAGVQPDIEIIGGHGPDRPARSRRSHRYRAERYAGVALALTVWQVASSTGVLSAQTLASPIDVWRAGYELAANGSLESAIWVSLQRVLIGLVLGVTAGVTLALVSGLSRVGTNLIDSPIQMLRFLPIIGLQPLIVLWLGIGNVAKVSLIVFGVMFPIYINTSAAIRDIDPKYLDLAHSVGLSRVGVVRRIVLPSALSGFLVGLRYATAAAWLILVFAEQINATNGIGYLIIRAQTFFQTNVIVVALCVYALLGLLTDAGVRFIERKALSWQASR